MKSDEEDMRKSHPLATKDGLEMMLAFMFYTGIICPDCGRGTRVKSKKWRECKKCGIKVEGKKLPEIGP